MILEVAILTIKEGQNVEFERDFRKAEHYLTASNGYLKHSLKKCLEQPNKYVLLVNWVDVDAHEIGFRQSDRYQNWKRLLHHYYDPFPTVQHYRDID